MQGSSKDQAKYRRLVESSVINVVWPKCETAQKQHPPSNQIGKVEEGRLLRVQMMCSHFVTANIQEGIKAIQTSPCYQSSFSGHETFFSLSLLHFGNIVITKQYTKAFHYKVCNFRNSQYNYGSKQIACTLVLQDLPYEEFKHSNNCTDVVLCVFFFIHSNQIILMDLSIHLNYSSIIVGNLPMILDIIMDSQVLVLINNPVNCNKLRQQKQNIFVLYQSKLPDLWGDRCMIVFILIVPSLTFLIFRESPFMPLLYVVQFLSQNMLYPSVMIHSGMLITIILRYSN